MARWRCKGPEGVMFTGMAARKTSQMTDCSSGIQNVHFSWPPSTNLADFLTHQSQRPSLRSSLDDDQTRSGPRQSTRDPRLPLQ